MTPVLLPACGKKPKIFKPLAVLVKAEWKAFLYQQISGFLTNCRVRVVFENCISSSFTKCWASWHWRDTRRLAKSEGQKQLADRWGRSPAPPVFKKQIHRQARAAGRTNRKKSSKQLPGKALRFNNPNGARFWKDEH